MKYEEYGVIDFVKDDFFVSWVKHPNSESDEFWREYIISHPDMMPTINQAKHLVLSIKYEDHVTLQPSEYTNMFENILKPNIRSKANSKHWVLKIAAVASVFIVASFIYFISHYDDNNVQKTTKQTISKIVKQNPKGQKSIITLPDGSIVKLNSESTLTYFSNYGKKDRYVQLTGEAFFDVKKSRVPFSIKTKGIETTVKGTTFNIRSYDNEDNTQVLVVSGEVYVSDKNGNSITLLPSELIEYSSSKNITKKSADVDFKNIIGWKDGILIFDSDSFDEVIRKVERWYGVTVTIKNKSLMKGTYTGEYHNKSLKRVLDGISYTSNFNYEILNDKQVLIK
ncbi:MAG: FecR family protein [Fulvivirga sp.]